MSEKEEEKGKEMEMEMEMKEAEVIIDYLHEHPLILDVARSLSLPCSACTKMIFPKERAYICRNSYCFFSFRLHQECAEMPREVTISMHPQHSLILKRRVPHDSWMCAVCLESKYVPYYYDNYYYYCKTCTTFQVHVGCATNIIAVNTRIEGHPSHPHPLTFQWKPGRSCSFRCDACGDIHKDGNPYICIGCQYWIHESCAALPPTKDFYHHHQHPLSLAYQVPHKYIKFDFTCRICFKALFSKYWIYHCQTCWYVVHINCANTNFSASIAIDVNACVVAFPLDDAKVDELIGSFVTKGKGVLPTNPHDHHETADHEFKFHQHKLQLVSSSTLQEQEEEELLVTDDEEEDEEIRHGKKSVCDGCTWPIITTSSSSTSRSEYCYLSCGECKYFLHWACFNLPHVLSSYLFHPQPDHNLTLQTKNHKLDFTWCYICQLYTNGLFYGCTKCDFKVDIKCACLPDTITHAAHPHNYLKFPDKHISGFWRRCIACDQSFIWGVGYSCGTCDITLHPSCCYLPGEVSDPTWDKHPLKLTYYPCVNHPDDFYCDVCEQEMNPKVWMYHCTECDVSIHPECFPTLSKDCRNIKFGQQFMAPKYHDHPLTFELLTTSKARCDVCKYRVDYGEPGLKCSSHKYCNFFMCFRRCRFRDQYDIFYNPSQLAYNFTIFNTLN